MPFFCVSPRQGRPCSRSPAKPNMQGELDLGGPPGFTEMKPAPLQVNGRRPQARLKHRLSSLLLPLSEGKLFSPTANAGHRKKTTRSSKPTGLVWDGAAPPSSHEMTRASSLPAKARTQPTVEPGACQGWAAAKRSPGHTGLALNPAGRPPAGTGPNPVGPGNGAAGKGRPHFEKNGTWPLYSKPASRPIP